jgi:cell division protein FtsZ
MGDDLVVTVIATGFEREDQPTPIPVAAARASRNGQQAAMASAGQTMGERSYAERPFKDLDRPTYLRRMGDGRESMERTTAVTDDEWDVPTFLRKQVD